MEALKILIGPLITLLVCFGGALIAVGRIKQVQSENEKKILENKQETEFLRKLCQSAVAKAECDRQSDKCRVSLLGVINEVKLAISEVKGLVLELHEKQTSKIEQLEEKREVTKDLQVRDMQKIMMFMGKVEQLLSNERYVTGHKETTSSMLEGHHV
jgi:hypothetical protein